MRQRDRTQAQADGMEMILGRVLGKNIRYYHILAIRQET